MPEIEYYDVVVTKTGAKVEIKRDKIIERLIDDDINRIIRDYNEMNDASVLAYILEAGFKGYMYYTDEQLIKELNEREFP